MLRAVPATERMAASRSKQFRSGILILAISLICSWVILPTLVLWGSGDPLAMLTARLISTGTGGVLVMKVKERSEKIVITTGMISPSWSLADVLALNALQKSMMLTPCGPSAVPTGGAGVALPAGICNFTDAVIFFAISTLFHLQELQLHRCGASENRHHHAQRTAFRIDVVHFAGEIRERSVDDAHRIVLLERHLGPRPFRRGSLPVQNLVHFFRAQWHRRIPAAHKTRHAGRVLHFMPQRVAHFHFHQHVTGINQALTGDLLAVAQFHHFFGGDQHLPDLVRKTEGFGTRAQRFRHLVLKPRVSVDDIPLLRRRFVIRRRGRCGFGLRFPDGVRRFRLCRRLRGFDWIDLYANRLY